MPTRWDEVRLARSDLGAVIFYEKQNPHEKRPLLNFVLSNSIWKDGKLIPNYRKPFDLLAVTNTVYKRQKAVSLSENGLLDFWLPVCNPLHNRSLSLAVNRKPSISTDYQRSGRSRRGRSGVDPDFIPLPDNHQISWLVPGFFDFIDHNMVKPLKIALCQFLQGSNRLFEGQSLLRQQIEIFFGNPKIARACVDRLV